MFGSSILFFMSLVDRAEQAAAGEQVDCSVNIGQYILTDPPYFHRILFPVTCLRTPPVSLEGLYLPIFLPC